MKTQATRQVTIERKLDYVRAEQKNTINGERSGELKAALDAETDEDLAAHYYGLCCSPHWANPVFGGNFKSWMRQVASALLARGINTVVAPSCFGPHVITIRD